MINKITFFLVCSNVALIFGENDLFGLKVSLDPVIKILDGIATTTEAPTAPGFSNRFDPGDETGSKCGVRQIDHTALIMGGENTKPGDWPWHVALYRMKSAKATLEYTCGGTLISSKVVITAGHCVVFNGTIISPERLSVVAGKHNLAFGSSDAQERGVFEIVVHPEFSSRTLKNDIALLKLSSQVKFTEYVQPICLWKGNDDRNSILHKIGYIVGWGMDDIGDMEFELRMATAPIQENLVCVKTNPGFYATYLSDYTFCAGHANGTSACNGDSGGGLYLSREDSGETVWYLRGVVSLSVARVNINVCDSNYYTILTDVAKYLSFIES